LSAIVSACNGVGVPNARTPLGSRDALANQLVSSAPAWVQGGEHPRYPSQRYLRGVGASAIQDSEAEARRAADEAARGEVALTLRAEVEREVVSVQRERGRVDSAGARSVLELDVQDLTRVVGSDILEGVEIVDRYRSATERSAYSLAAMDRGVAARSVAARVEAKRREAEAQLELARRFIAEGKRAQTLGTLLSAYDLILQAQVADSAHRVLVGKPAPSEIPDRAAEVRAQLEEFRLDLEFEVVSGQDQRALPGTPLTTPIVLRVALRDGSARVPVPGVTFSLRPSRPGAAELSANTVITDSNGEARFTVPVVYPVEETANAIIASLDAARIGSFEVPDVLVRFTVGTRDTLRILVVIEEVALGKPVASPVVALGIQDALRQAGIPVVSADGPVARLGRDKLLHGRLEDLREALAGEVDILLRGKAEARRIGSFGSQTMAQSTAKLQALDLTSGRALSAFESKPSKESRESVEHAALLTLQDLSRRAGAEVVQRLERVLRGNAS